QGANQSCHPPPLLGRPAQRRRLAEGQPARRRRVLGQQAERTAVDAAPQGGRGEETDVSVFGARQFLMTRELPSPRAAPRGLTLPAARAVVRRGSRRRDTPATASGPRPCRAAPCAACA